jgi:hypothetical protein
MKFNSPSIYKLRWSVGAHFTTLTPHFTPLNHTLPSSSSSDDVEGQVSDALFSRRLKLHRCSVKCDCELVHERLHHDYFTGNYVYPLNYSGEGTICE